MEFNISLIIPVYNVEKYLRECIDSVVNQNYDKLEIIIINDGSTDNSEEIIQEYLKKYQNIKYIKQENKGLSEARNVGIKYATGKYMMFLDSDDYLEIGCIKKICQKIKEKDSDIIIYGYKNIYEDLENIKGNKIVYKNIDENKIYNGKYVSEKILLNEIGGFACNKIFKKEYLEKNKLIFEPNRYIEDFYPVFKQIYNCGKIVFINEAFYNYRQRATSITNNKNEKLLNDYIYSIEQILYYIKKNNINYNKSILDTFKMNSFNAILDMFYNSYKDNKLYKTFYNKGYNKYEPTFKELTNNKYLEKKSKLSMLLWKLRVYHIFMPILRKIQNHMKSSKNITT